MVCRFRYLDRNRITRILKYLMSVVGARLNHIHKNTGISLSSLGRLLNHLVKIGILDFDGKYYKISSFLKPLIGNLMSKYDVDTIFDSKYVNLLALLVEPQRLGDIVISLSMSERTIRRKLGELMQKGIVARSDETYMLVRDKVLEVVMRVGTRHQVLRILLNPYVIVV